MKNYIFSLLLFLASYSSYSTTYYAVANGAWTDANAAMWSLTSGGGGGAGVPGAGDDIYTNGFIVGVTVTRICRNVFVDDVTVNGLFVNAELTITGTMIGHSRDLFGFLGPSPNNPSVAVVAGGSSVIFTGTNTNTNGGATGVNIVIGYWSSTVRIPNVELTFGGGNTRVFAVSNGSDDIDIGNLTITSGTLSFDLATVTGLRIPGTLIVDGTAHVSVPFKGGAANTTLIGSVDISGNTLVFSGAFLNSTIFNISSGGSIVVDNDEPNGWWFQTSSPSTVTLDANSTVFYTSDNPQSIPARTYGNLSISSGGNPITKSLTSSGSLTVEGDLYVGGSTTFSTSSNTNNMVFEGDLINDGVLTITRPTTFNGGGTQVIGGGSASGITFSSSVLISNAMNFDTDITFDGTVTSGTNNLSFAKDLTSNTNFNCAGTVTIDGAIAQSITGTGTNTFTNLTISNTSTAIVNGTGSSVTGTLTSSSSSSFNANGKLTLVSDAGGIARVATIPGTANFSGSVIYERYISNDQVWHNIGMPVSGTVTDITNSGFTVNGNDLGRYNEGVAGDFDQGWETADFPFSNIDDTQGYSLWTRTADTPEKLVFTGELNTGNMSLPVSRTIQNGLADDGWNLVNNPYASQIDWGNPGWSTTNIDGTIYVWNGTGYNAINGSGTIASGQSFWVHATGANPILNVTQAIKTGSSAIFYRNVGAVNDLSITLSDGSSSDLTRIRFIDDATEEFDSPYDGYKLQNDIFNLSSLSEGGMDLSINTLPMIGCSRVVKLNMTNITEGAYQLKFDGLYSFEIAFEFTLIDNFLNTSATLSENYSYDFSVTADAASWGSTRFEIEFSAASIDSNVMYSIDNKCGLGATVLITNTQAGINYILSQNGVVIKSQLATSSTLEIALSTDEISEGLNQFDLTLDNSGCNNTLLIKNGIEFTVIGVQEITATTNGLSCGTGQVSVKAEGAIGNGYYRWYESIDAIDPIPNQNSNEYLTPAIDATKFYYVTVVNEYGCESSTRTKVVAEIMNVTQPIISVEGDVISTSAIADNYIWYQDELLIEGENTESIAVVESGAYSVEVITNTCSATSENIIVEILGVKDLKEYGIEIYPNPVLDVMTINSELSINSIFIFDTKGVEVMSIENNIPNEIDMKNIKKGIYIINIATDNQIITYRVRKK